jgi:group II intron reverse transcriptase/maturase
MHEEKGRSRSVSKRLDQPASANEPDNERSRLRARDVARDEGVSSLQALQRVLYRSAKQNPTRRFHALYDKLTRGDVMGQAWINVVSNQGAPGVDGVSIESVAAGGYEGVTAFLDELSAEVKAETYRPLPLRRVHIPKAGTSGATRPLGIPSLRDRVLMSAAKLILEPIFEAQFSPTSFGFRPKRSAHDALEVIRLSANAGAHWVLDADIKSCFDEIDHDALMALIERRVSDRAMLKLLRGWLRAGIIEGGVYSDSDAGTPQGSPISPLLCNVALSVLDEALATATLQTGTVVRYADDCVTRMKRRIRCRGSKLTIQCCAKDGGVTLRDRPAGRGLKPPRGAPVKSRGAELAEKAGLEPVRCESRRRAKANHSMTRRKRRDDIKTGSSRYPGMSLVGACRLTRRCPALRWRELDSGFGTERVNLAPDTVAEQQGEVPTGQRERDLQALNREEQSSDVGDRGGPPRTSDEGPVMGLERRGRAVRVRWLVNHSCGMSP